MKKLIPVLMLAVTTTTAFAQSQGTINSKNPVHRAKVIAQATKGQQKTTAVYQRIKATSGYALDMTDFSFGLQDSGVYKYSNARGSFIDFAELFLNDYGLEGTLSYDTAVKYTKGSSTIEPSARYSATFNTNNKRTGFIQAYHNNGNFINSSEEKGVFNTNGDITTRTHSYWNGSQNKWEATNVTEYKYNGQNKLISDSSYDVMSAQPTYLTHYYYDGNGNVETELSFNWNGASWDSSYRTTNTYYTNNKLKTSIEEEYNIDSARWENYYMDSIGYNSNGDLDYRLYSEWDSAGAVWENSERETRTYANAQLSKLSMELWDEVSSSWEKYLEGEANYNSNGDLSRVDGYGYFSGIKLLAFVQNLYYEEYYNVDVANTPAAGVLKVYPNPVANGLVNVELGESMEAKVQLLNMSGQVVHSINSGNAQKIQVSTAGLPAGNYLLTVTENNGAPARQMITVQ